MAHIIPLLENLYKICKKIKRKEKLENKYQNDQMSDFLWHVIYFWFFFCNKSSGSIIHLPNNEKWGSKLKPLPHIIIVAIWLHDTDICCDIL